MPEGKGISTVVDDGVHSVEMVDLSNCSGNDKRTRFQVNLVCNENLTNSHPEYMSGRENDEDSVEVDTDDVHSVTERSRLNSEYVKSFRHLTREALPHVDNYRNIMSLQAANRPTLDELHNATLSNKSSPLVIGLNGKVGDVEGQLKFGWIQGVLVRCLLNIWGVMLFLRLSWVVAQAGVGEAILLVLTTTVVTSITALSMSAISTNGVIKGGGTYYMISRSLGPEFGGSIGLIFSLANAVACAMYVVGFCESLRDLLLTFDLQIVDADVQDIRIVGTITIVILTGVVTFGMEWEAKAQIGLLVILLIALLDFFIGSFIPPGAEEMAKGFVGYNATVLKANWKSDYRNFDGVEYNFFSVFAVFFPAATGILAGANISGDLKDPQTAIPRGTILAIIITTISYILMAVVCGASVVRQATGDTSIPLYANECFVGNCTYGLHNSFQVVELVSAFGPIIYAGCFAATLSSALASLVSAPKVFQALCKDRLYPRIEWFAKGYGKNNEPLRGYVLTFIIAVAFILIGDLNLIAPLISNFFLAAYTLINFSTFHASFAKPVGWRPTFKYHNMWLSLMGAIFCVLVMFLISWWTALITLAVVLALYLIVAYRKPDVNWGSTTQAQIYKNALQAVHQLNNVEEHVKNYRPQILVLSGLPSARPILVEFAYLLTKNLSMLVCGHINTSPLHQRVRNVLNAKAGNWLKAHNIRGFYVQVDGVNFQEGCTAFLKASGIGKLRPNILLMGYKSDWQRCPKDDLRQYFEVLHNAFDLHLGVGILRLPKGLEVKSNNTNTTNSEVVRDALENHGGNNSVSGHANSTNSQNGDGGQSSSSSENGSAINDPPPQQLTGNNSKQLEETDSSGAVASSVMYDFLKKPNAGTIDVWWLYDDGGLTLLLPYIMTTRRNWSRCTLRVFALANKSDELELEHRNMASLLAKFRIDYSDLQVVPNINTQPMEATQSLFESLIAKFRVCSLADQNNQGNGDNLEISDAELLANKDKTTRHLRLRELLLQHSHNATMIMMTLPMPRKNIVCAPLYMAWLELLTRNMPPILLLRGNQTSVLTFYS